MLYLVISSICSQEMNHNIVHKLRQASAFKPAYEKQKSKMLGSGAAVVGLSFGERTAAQALRG